MEAVYNDSVGPWLANATAAATAATTAGGDDDMAEAVARADRCLLSKFIIHSLVEGVICLIGILGNLISLWVLAKDTQTPVASFVLQTLAVADNVFLGLWMLHYPLRYLLEYCNQRTHISYTYVRLHSYPVLFIAQTATILLTVLIALSRYIAICRPFEAAQTVTLPNVKKAVGVVTLFSVLYNLPRFFEGYLMRTSVNGTSRYSYTLTAMGASPLYNLIYFDILYYLVSFVVPLLVLAVLNTKLTIAYRAIQQRRSRMNTRNRSEQDNNITLIMILVVLAFMMCQMPARIVQIVWRYETKGCGYQFILIEVSKSLEVLNSSINFFIYCVFRRQFRDVIYKHLCGERKNNNTPAANAAQAQKLLPVTTTAITAVTEENHNKTDETTC